jgi:hypothetical protein
MQTDARKPLLFVTCWALLSVWLFFANLALAEQMNLTVETSVQDEHALSQLASGLKSDMPSLGAPSGASVTAEVTELAFSLSFDIVPQLKRPMRHDPPSLPLYQQLRVYRI